MNAKSSKEEREAFLEDQKYPRFFIKQLIVSSCHAPNVRTVRISAAYSSIY